GAHSRSRICQPEARKRFPPPPKSYYPYRHSLRTSCIRSSILELLMAKAQPEPIAARTATRQSISESYPSVVARQFRKNRIAVAGLCIVALLFAVAAMADFIANDKPFVLVHKTGIYFPIIRDYAVWLRLAQWQPEFLNVSYKEYVVRKAKDVD